MGSMSVNVNERSETESPLFAQQVLV